MSSKPYVLAGEFLRKQRRRLGKTQAKIASDVARNPSIVSEWESGKTKVTYGLIAAVAGAYGITSEKMSALYSADVSPFCYHPVDILPLCKMAALSDLEALNSTELLHLIKHQENVGYELTPQQIEVVTRNYRDTK